MHEPETTQQLLDTCHEHFLGVIGRDDCRTHTSLRDTTGYVRATNGLLLSSRGIHGIDSLWAEPFGENGDAGVDVHGLRDAVDQMFAEGRLFSELGLPWAVAQPVPVRLDSFHHVERNDSRMWSPA